MTAIDTIARYSRRLPPLPAADWAIRIPLAIIILNQGYLKLPNLAADAETYGLPVFAYALAAFAELAGGVAILAGGLLRNWIGDLLTRLGGLAIAIVVAGVILVVYFGPFLAWQFQAMLLAGGLFFALRGNGDMEPEQGY